MTKKVKMLVDYENKWVALYKNNSKVLASAATIKQLNSKLENIENKPKDILITKVLPFNVSLAPYASI